MSIKRSFFIVCPKIANQEDDKLKHAGAKNRDWEPTQLEGTEVPLLRHVQHVAGVLINIITRSHKSLWVQSSSDSHGEAWVFFVLFSIPHAFDKLILLEHNCFAASDSFLFNFVIFNFYSFDKVLSRGVSCIEKIGLVLGLSQYFLFKRIAFCQVVKLLSSGTGSRNRGLRSF